MIRSVESVELVQSYQDYESRAPIVHDDSNVIGNQKSSKEGHVPIDFLSLCTLKNTLFVQFCGIYFRHEAEEEDDESV